MKKILFFILILANIFLLSACIISDGSSMSEEEKIASGLTEALTIGTKNTIEKVSIDNGYYNNINIKIDIPNELRLIKETLLLLGLSNYVEDFIISMNKSAEKAAPYAKEIFINAILEMTIQDAIDILYGDDDAACVYFESKMRPELLKLFKPIIKEEMRKNEVYNIYDTVMSYSVYYVDFDIEEYVLNEAIDGIFHVLKEEEREIRKNPMARVTVLLQEVFGLLD